MYSRSYLGADGRPSLPENYDGIAFFETEKPDACNEKVENKDTKALDEPCIAEEKPSNKNPWDTPPRVAKMPPRSDNNAPSSGLSSLPIFGGLGEFFKGIIPEGFGLSKIGTEEILIIAAAIFLFTSKDGDNECAVMLLLLLLIS